MSAPNRPARLNRTLLVLLGLVLLVAGAAGLAFGTGLLPGLDPATPLLPTPLAPPTWAAYAAIVVAVVIGLLCLRWLLAQAQRRPKASTWTLPTAAGPGAGTTRIGSADAADAVVSDVSGYPGVSKAVADLTGERNRPTVTLRVTASQEASATELRHRIHDHALPRLRESLDLDGLHAQLVLVLDSTPPSRTR